MIQYYIYTERGKFEKCGFKMFKNYFDLFGHMVMTKSGHTIHKKDANIKEVSAIYNPSGYKIAEIWEK